MHSSSALRAVEPGFPSSRSSASHGGLILRQVSLEERLSIYADCFPELDSRPVHRYIRTRLPVQLPAGASEYMVWPRRVALGPTYPEQMNKLMRVMKLSGRMPHVWGEEHWEHLTTEARTLNCLETIGQRQIGDYLVVSIQRGARHAGSSANEVRRSFLDHEFEFGLGTFEQGCILLTENQPLPTSRILCVGDTYHPHTQALGPDSARVACYETSEKERTYNLTVEMFESDEPNPLFVSPTGFLTP